MYVIAIGLEKTPGLPGGGIDAWTVEHPDFTVQLKHDPVFLTQMQPAWTDVPDENKIFRAVTSSDPKIPATWADLCDRFPKGLLFRARPFEGLQGQTIYVNLGTNAIYNEQFKAIPYIQDIHGKLIVETLIYVNTKSLTFDVVTVAEAMTPEFFVFFRKCQNFP
jgi:hypothetical protein